MATISLTSSASAASAEMGEDWTWQGTVGGDWTNANWQRELGGADLNYQNTASVLASFSGSVFTNGGIPYMTSTQALTVGSIVYGSGGQKFHNGRTTVADVTDNMDGTYTYKLNRANADANAGFNETALIARTGANAVFNNVSGTVTVAGEQVMNTLYVKGGNIVFDSNSGTLRFNPHMTAESEINLNSGNAEFRVDISNAEANLNKNLYVTNKSTGTLAFSGNTIYASDGAVFVNDNAAYVTSFNNVTFATNGGGKWLRFNRGTYIFDGDNVKPLGGDVRFGADAGDTFAIINADGALRNTGGGNVTIAQNASANANVSVQGLFDAGGGIVYVGGNAGLGVLNVSGTGEVKNTGVFVIASGVGSGTLNISGRGRVETGSYAQVGTGSSSRATLNISGTGSFTSGAGANSNLELANHAASYVVVNVSDSGTFATGGDNKIRVGVSGTAIVNVSGNGYVRSSDLNVGYGGVGILNIDGNAHVYNPNGKWLYINKANTVEGTAGIVNLNSGTLTVNGVAFGSKNDRDLTVSNTAYLNITGGVLQLTGNYGIATGDWDTSTQAKPLQTASDTQINLGGGTISASQGWTMNMDATLTGSNGNIKFNTNGTATIGGQLSGRGGLEVVAGTLLITSTAGGNTVNTYTGQTVVDSGATLQLSNLAELTISLADLGALPAFDGAGTLTLNGTVTISDDLTQLSGGYQLIGAGLLGATLTLNDNWLAGFTKSGDQWLCNADNDIFFDKTTGILTLAQIPEPSALALLLTGGALLLALRRRK